MAERDSWLVDDTYAAAGGAGGVAGGIFSEVRLEVPDLFEVWDNDIIYRCGKKRGTHVGVSELANPSLLSLDTDAVLINKIATKMRRQRNEGEACGCESASTGTVLTTVSCKAG